MHWTKNEIPYLSLASFPDLFKNLWFSNGLGDEAMSVLCSYITWHFIDCSSEVKRNVGYVSLPTLYNIGGGLLIKCQFWTDRNSSDVGLLQTNEEYSIDQLEHCYQVYSCVLVQSISVHFPLLSFPELFNIVKCPNLFNIVKCPNFHIWYNDIIFH